VTSPSRLLDNSRASFGYGSLLPATMQRRISPSDFRCVSAASLLWRSVYRKRLLQSFDNKKLRDLAIVAVHVVFPIGGYVRRGKLSHASFVGWRDCTEELLLPGFDVYPVNIVCAFACGGSVHCVPIR
jgi:hypothetical protein